MELFPHFSLHLNVWNHHLMLGTCGKPVVRTLFGRFDLMAYRSLWFLVLRSKTCVLEKTFLIFNHIQKFVVQKFGTHNIYFSCLLFANSCIPVVFELFSFKNEMGKCFSEQDLNSFWVLACIYYNLTVCSFLPYLSPSLSTEIAWRDGHYYSIVFMGWGTQKELYRDQNLQAKIYNAAALNWQGTDFGYSIWFSEQPRT